MTSSSWPATRSRRLIEWVESPLEGRFRLTINREKTRVVQAAPTARALDFLGFTFRYDRDLYGRDRRYLNVFPSNKSLARLREKLRELTGSRHAFMPIPELIGRSQSAVAGWKQYFSSWLSAVGVS